MNVSEKLREVLLEVFGYSRDSLGRRNLRELVVYSCFFTLLLCIMLHLTFGFYESVGMNRTLIFEFFIWLVYPITILNSIVWGAYLEYRHQLFRNVQHVLMTNSTIGKYLLVWFPQDARDHHHHPIQVREKSFGSRDDLHIVTRIQTHQSTSGIEKHSPGTPTQTSPTGVKKNKAWGLNVVSKRKSSAAFQSAPLLSAVPTPGGVELPFKKV